MADRSLSVTDPIRNGGKKRRPCEKHGMTGKPILRSYFSMIDRCTNENSPDYPRYGGRGITVCERWRMSFLAFQQDMGERPPGTQLDRIDNNLGYEPGNCRWVTSKTNNRNRWNSLTFTVDGEALHVNEIAERTGIHRDTILWRIKKGASIEEAIAAPIRENFNRLLFRGEMVPMPELVQRYGNSASTITRRIKQMGMSVEDAVTRPLIKKSGRRGPKNIAVLISNDD